LVLAEGALTEKLVVGGEALLGARVVGGQFGDQLVLDLLDHGVAVGLGVLLGVERVLEAVADLGLQLFVVGLVGDRRGEGPLGLAGKLDQLIDGGDDLLDLGVGKLDGGEDDLFGLFLGAGLDHHNAVFVADDHDVDGGGGALRVGGVDDELAIDAAHAHGADGGAEGNVRQSQGASSGVDADHVRIVFLVGGEDQGDDLGLIAEAIGEERADGAIDLAAGEDFFFAGPAFTLDEAAGNTSAGVGVLALVHGEGEEVDAFARVRRCDCSRQDDGFAGGDERCAGGLLGHAASLKDQTLAAGKLD
jgi:hypothetical protein